MLNSTDIALLVFLYTATGFLLVAVFFMLRKNGAPDRT